MAVREIGRVFRQIQVAFEVGTVAGLTDRQLVERFMARRDPVGESAFAALVQRHGPMVLRVCRGILRNHQDAEDAFQATFLILARKGGSLWVRDSVGPWLHGVACRVAACSRASIARRRSTSAGRRRTRRRTRVAATTISTIWIPSFTKSSVGCPRGIACRSCSAIYKVKVTNPSPASSVGRWERSRAGSRGVENGFEAGSRDSVCTRRSPSWRVQSPRECAVNSTIDVD